MEVGQTLPLAPFLSSSLHFVVLLFLTFYAIFALIIVRQVDLMSKTLITPVSPIVKAFSIVHAGIAIGLTVFMLGVL